MNTQRWVPSYTCQAEFVPKVSAYMWGSGPRPPEPQANLRTGTEVLRPEPCLPCTAQGLFLQSCGGCRAWHTMEEAPAPWFHCLERIVAPSRPHELRAGQNLPKYPLQGGFYLGPSAPNQGWSCVQLSDSSTHSLPDSLRLQLLLEDRATQSWQS